MRGLAKQISKRVDEVTGTKFCTACRKTKPAEGGGLRKTKNMPRWVCADCQRAYEERRKQGLPA